MYEIERYLFYIIKLIFQVEAGGWGFVHQLPHLPGPPGQDDPDRAPPHPFPWQRRPRGARATAQQPHQGFEGRPPDDAASCQVEV